MGPRRLLPIACLLLPVLALSAPPPAQGLPEREETHLEGFLGYFVADSVLDFDNPFSFGARGGYRWKRFGVEATVSRFESDFELRTTTGEQEVIALDLSAVLYLNPRSAWEWSLFAGPGWRYSDTVNRFGEFMGRPLEGSATNDEFSAHLGVAVRITVGERLYVRPDFRVRSGVDEEVGGDIEASVALGYSFF